jgi:hypothetical protein
MPLPIQWSYERLLAHLEALGDIDLDALDLSALEDLCEHDVSDLLHLALAQLPEHDDLVQPASHFFLSTPHPCLHMGNKLCTCLRHKLQHIASALRSLFCASTNLSSRKATKN